MTASFRAIALRMDPTTTPLTLRQLHARHRWLLGAEAPVSFRSVARRHAHPQTTTHRFLAYNTWLLPGVNIEFQLTEVLAKLGITAAEALAELAGQGVISIAGFIEAVGGDAVEAVAHLVGVKQTEQIAGISLAKAVVGLGLVVALGPLAAPIVAAYIADMSLREKIEALLGASNKAAVAILEAAGVGVSQLATFFGIDPLAALIALQITPALLILKLCGVDIPDHWAIGAKPAIAERARAIGGALGAGGYEIAALTEVWDQSPEPDSARALIAQGFADAGRAINPPARGPGKQGSALLDSGLHCVTLGARPIVEIATHTYAARGDRLLDSDAWACKGALLARIDLGVGILDLYLTHLISGDDLLGSVLRHIPGFALPSTYADDLRLAQAQELVVFIGATHDPDHVAIVCGDTNIRAEEGDEGTAGTTAYAALRGLLAQVPVGGGVALFEDAWATQRAYLPARGNSAGKTSGPEDAAERFAPFCPLRQSPDDPAQWECDEGQATAAQSGSRIDYIFVERPTAAHTFDLDCSRVRRRPFRHPGLPENQLYLSDHLGLDLLLIASPR